MKIYVSFFQIRLAAFVETHGTCLKVDKVVQTANMTSWKVHGYIMMVLEAGLLLYSNDDTQTLHCRTYPYISLGCSGKYSILMRTYPKHAAFHIFDWWF